jgi:[ribosomal protein S18]-alanine N-acetyltransferase
MDQEGSSCLYRSAGGISQAGKEEYGAQEFILEVRVSNTPAIGMYEKHQYTKIKTLEAYYRDGENAYMMALRI